MNIANLSIRRPVFVVMVMAFFVVVGLVSYNRLGMNMFPKVVLPYITVTTTYPGASPDVIATEVTKKLEDSIAVTEGIDRMYSYSMENVSIAIISFEAEKDIDVVAQDVRDKVALVANDLPADANDPVVSKLDVNAMPTLYYTVSSETMGPRELLDYVDRHIADNLQQAPGVADITLAGGLEREIKVVLKPDRLEAFGMDPSFIGQMVSASNVDFPAGSIKQGGLDYVLRVPSQYESVSDIGDTVVASIEGQVVRLGDIAAIIDTEKEKMTDARLDGVSTILLSVIKRGDADIVAMAENVQKRAEAIRHDLPPGVDLELVVDYSKYIVNSLKDINMTIILGAILASFVVWLFIGRMRFTIPITVAILVSVITAYAAVNFAGFTLNFLSMLALAVAIGLIVDDSIVVQENLIREYEITKDVTKATLQGTGQVALAVIASTSTIIAVFLPIGFMSGMMGQFFKEFGVTVAFAVGISTIVALSLVPLVFYHSTVPKELSGIKNYRFWLAPIEWLSRTFNGIHLGFSRIYERVEAWYGRFLQRALRRRALVIAVAMVFFLCAIPIFMLLQIGFTPDMDQGRFQVFVELPVEATLERTDEAVRRVEDIVADLPEVETVLSVVGMTFGGFFGGGNQTNTGQVIGVMKDKPERQLHLRWWGIIPIPYRYSSSDMVELARDRVTGIPGAKISVSVESEGGAHPVQLVFTDPDYDRIKRVAAQAEEILRDIPGAVNVDNTERPGKLEYRIDPKLSRMAQLGITPAQLGQYLRVLYEGDDFSTYREAGEEYDITLILPESARENLQSLRALKVYSSRLGKSVALETIADIKLGQEPSVIRHSDRLRSIDVFCDVARGVGSGTIVAKWRAAMNEQQIIPPTTEVTAIGESDMITEMFEQFLLALFLGLLFSYMVLASQFNSYKHPFTIMMSVPLATTGALLFVLVTGKSFNMMSFLGIIMLTGLVTKNAILLIDFANQARARGESINDALVSAGLRRMRPILMTAFTTIAALLPVAFGLGEGADFRSPLAVAVIGGMFFATALTLVVIPVVYTLIEQIGGRKKLAGGSGGSTAVE